MKLTTFLIATKFHEYNKLYFDGKLGYCKFALLPKSNTAYGRYDRKIQSKRVTESRISLGRCIKWNEKRLEEVLLHEMIHMYVETIEGKLHDGLFGHGWRFRRQCRRIHKQHGIRVRSHIYYDYINKKSSPKLWERIIMYLIDW